MKVILALFIISIAACSGPQDPNKQMQEQMNASLSGPRTGVFLRASFDDDPTHFIGRFIANGSSEDDIDENRGIQTECSKFVTYKDVKASGQFDEYYNSSTDVKGGLGINPGGQAVDAVTGGGDGNFSHSSGTTIRVKYDLTRKLVANIEDPAGFRACCDSSPDNCTDSYIGEFWYGSGQLFERSGRQTGGDADVNLPQGQGGIEVADGWQWRRSTSFSDVFFAFRVTNRTAGGDDCAWANRPPKSNEGQYFVGVSPDAPSEDIARTMAMRNARTQVVQYLGEVITATSSNNASVIDGYVKSENVVNSVAEGVASFVKDDRYCPAEKVETPEGVKYIVKVLAFFPEEKQKEAATAAVDEVEKAAKADGKLTPDLKKALQNARTTIAK